jgi:hypothetical protein
LRAFEFEFDLVLDCRQFMRSRGGFSVTLNRQIIDLRRRAAQARATLLRLAKGQAASGRRGGGLRNALFRSYGFRMLGGRQRLSQFVAKDRQEEMSARGLYRTKMPEGGAEYARVVYGIASPPGEIPRPLYEARGYEPPFDTLPTKREGEAVQASNTDEADSGDVVTCDAAISA